MSLPNAFVTLLTTPSYLPGALVLLHSILDLHPEPREFKTVCLVTPETVDAKTIGTLREAGWDMVIGVEPIGSGIAGDQGLRLMGKSDHFLCAFARQTNCTDPQAGPTSTLR
jgi:hypothetical protein